MSGFAMFGLALLVFAVKELAENLYKVPHGMVYTVERFGKYARTLEPGWHWINRPVERIGYKVNMQETTKAVGSQILTTQDDALVSVNATIAFQMTDVSKACYDHQNLDNALMHLVGSHLSAMIGTINQDELSTNRTAINTRLQQRLNEATATWGIDIKRIEITDIDMING